MKPRIIIQRKGGLKPLEFTPLEFETSMSFIKKSFGIRIRIYSVGVWNDADINAAINILARLYDSEINLYTSAEKVKEILTKRANAVLSASVETAQLGLQQVVPINLGLSAKSGLSKKSSKKLAKVG